MTWGRFLFSHFGGVAINAVTRFLKLRQLIFNRSHFRVSSFLTVLVTSGTHGDWHVRCQSTQGGRARNIDVTRRALHHMLAFATFVTEHRGLTWWQIDITDESRSGLMTTCAVVTGGFLVFPMTIEAGVVRMRQGLEKLLRLRIRISRSHKWHNVRDVVRLVTDRAIVIVRLFLVVGPWFKE